MNLSKKELMAFVSEQQKVFDIVRLVNVSLTSQFLISDEGILKEEPYECYAFWNKKSRCENCISAKAFNLKRKLTKFEFVENDVYFIMAIYTEIDNTPYAIELVTKLNDETLFGTHGKSGFIECIENHNKKLYIDALTGAYNRYYYEEQLKTLNRFNSIVMIDVDNFKNINDTYGHLAGDRVLKKIVGIMKMHVRTSDLVVRIGGDEFLLIFQEIPKEILVERLESIRKAVAGLRILENPRLRVSISMGAIYSNNSNIHSMDMADKALYGAKERKNTIVFEEV